ncbi:unnamed protein product [Rotaria sordida]|uniref:BTB domain-containing protein n=1 Tax=Rotaria sordida TaxID=392033 RepID=A0A814SKP0_9BILA|nr:unnamed protein product [Rotaria sordida]CAF1386534.1 unnamed protein product [Rotaria sordida]
MNLINDQPLSSKQRDFQHFDKWKNKITNPIKRRRKALNQVSIVTTDNLIQIHRNDYNSLSTNKIYNRITINISGNRYETYLSTLENYPNTLLGNKQKRMNYWDEQENELFFDRHQSCFEAILYYYQSNGCLRRPDYIPLDIFLEEISFFDLGPQTISQIDKSENVSIIKHINLPNWLWRRYIWFYLEYPQHSTYARILHFISILLTIIFCIALAIETLPKYNEQSNNLCKKEKNITSLTNNISICLTKFSSPFFIIQTICVSYFTIEFILRLISTPSYYKFIFTLYNWLDLSAIIPYFVVLSIRLNYKKTYLNENLLIGLRIFRILSFFRVVKIYLIGNQLKSLRVLCSTLKESFIDLIIMIITLTLLAFMFGVAIYFAENDVNGHVFDSMPKATYWGILTITALGYGDICPTTVIGRILACLCAYCGITMSGMLVSILVDRYRRIYNRQIFSPEEIVSPADPSDHEYDKKAC